MTEDNLSSAGKDPASEAVRLITKDGIIIRQMHNRDAEVLYPNGLRANFSKKEMEWVVTAKATRMHGQTQLAMRRALWEMLCSKVACTEKL